MFKFYASMRSEILSIVTGVENSRGSLFWDNTSPNWVTRDRLETLFSKYLTGAKSYGLLMVTRHCDCGQPEHHEYPISNRYGLSIEYKSADYIWNGGQFFQGKRKCVCPCSGDNRQTEHHVVEDIIYDANACLETCGTLEGILCDIHDAILCAGEKMPRSAIREYLLRAIIRINDVLLPEPMETFISNRLVIDSKP